jgi:hypothetical protein
MQPDGITESALTYISEISNETVLRIAHASVHGPTVDPTYINILSKLTLSNRESNQKFESLVFLFLYSLKLTYAPAPQGIANAVCIKYYYFKQNIIYYVHCPPLQQLHRRR